MKILVINPGSTSTKISLFGDEKCIFDESVFHDAPVLLAYPHVNDQLPFRRQVTEELLAQHGYTIKDIDVFMGRGGSAYPQPSGVTEVDDRLYADTRDGVGGSEHPAKLGVMLAHVFARETGARAFTMDPTNVDELCDEARLTGIRGVYRNAQSHVLNQKSVARIYAREVGKKYEDMELIVCHIDGGITVNAHSRGRMIDGNVGSGGEGAFTPTRIGTVPVLPLLDYIDSHSVAEVRRMCSRAGGFVSWFGTSDADVVHDRVVQGDDMACRVWNTMIYQIAKDIGQMAVVLKGRAEAILLTGGLVRFQDIVDGIRERCGWIAPVWTYPGEVEQKALARGALQAMRGEVPVRRYTGRPVWCAGDGSACATLPASDCAGDERKA